MTSPEDSNLGQRWETANPQIPTQRCGAVGFLRVHAEEDVNERGKVTRVKLVHLHHINMNSRLRFRLMLITALLLTIATGVVAAQSGGGGGSDLVGIIESIIQFLQSIADIFSG
jgi:hypothetical protein